MKLRTLLACSLALFLLEPLKAYAQYDDSIEALWAKEACKLYSNGIGSGNMSQISMLLMNPLSWSVSDNLDPNVGLKYWNWLKAQQKKYGSGSEKISPLVISQFLPKAIAMCPNNWGKSELENVKKSIRKANTLLGQ